MKFMQNIVILGLLYGSCQADITFYTSLFRKLEQNQLILSSRLGLDNQGLEPAEMDALALEYCQKHPNTYVAVVWPRAISYLPQIKKALSGCGTLLYQKNFNLFNNGPSLFFQLIHPEIFHGRIQDRLEGKYEQFIRNYIPYGMQMPYRFCVILFESQRSVSQILKCKYAIRQALKMSFFSIHINDSRQEALAAAQVVFDDEAIARINIA